MNGSRSRVATDQSAEPQGAHTTPRKPAAQLAQRVSYGIFALSTLFLLFLVDIEISRAALNFDGPLAALLRNGSVVPLVTAFVSVMCTVELIRFLHARGVEVHRKLAFVAVPLIVLVPWFAASGALGQRSIDVEGHYWMLTSIMLATVASGLASVSRKDPAGALRDGAGTMLVILYIGLMLSFAVQLRCTRDLAADQAAWFLLIAVFVTKSSDIGGYFVGSAIGRTKLLPRISPGKTLAGTIGGLLASGLVAVFFEKLPQIGEWFGVGPGASHLIHEMTFTLTSAPEAAGPYYPICRAFIFGILLSAAGQMGDLFESCFKRDAGMKDSGSIIPTYGGVLDLVDSPLMSLPVAWLLLTGFWQMV